MKKMVFSSLNPTSHHQNLDAKNHEPETFRILKTHTPHTSRELLWNETRNHRIIAAVDDVCYLLKSSEY